jgi:hypothetical protein
VNRAPSCKRWLRIAFTTLAIAMLPQTGCAQRAANSQGLAYDLARERALKLVPMMSTAQVQSLLGPPNQTGFQMLGGVPWAVGSMGQVWTYEWKPNELETKKLVLFFGFAEKAGWLLNSWSWS